jgi:dienelactone hydrolase
MTTEAIRYTIDDAAFDAFVARPSEPGDRPAVLVVHAWEGRGAHEEDSARRLADLGYVGVAIDLYGIDKRGSDPASCEALMMPLVHNPAILERRITTALETAQGLDGVDATRVAIIGYCFGGYCATLAARMGLPLRAAVSFHGELQIPVPLDADPQARILALHGQDDPLVPTDDIAAFALEMQRIGAEWQLHVYPGAAHSFTIPTANAPDLGTVFHPEAARRSWSEMQALLEETLD